MVWHIIHWQQSMHVSDLKRLQMAGRWLVNTLLYWKDPAWTTWWRMSVQHVHWSS
jgi:hypothetical protein